MAEVPARMAQGFPRRAGDYIFGRDASDEHVTEFIFCCPCGCGRVRSAPLKSVEPAATQQWEWNRDLQRPTLSPGLSAPNGCQWRGRLIDGVFRSA
jgi:hypothetical protein